MEMKEQGTGQGDRTSDNMAATASGGYAESHVQPGHAQMGMDHHHFHGHGQPQNSVMFGDATLFHYDTSPHDQVLPLDHHNSQAILESSEVDFLNTFFSDPDSLDQIQLSPYDFDNRDKSASTNNNVFSAAIFDPQGGANGSINPSTLAPSQATLHKTASHQSNHMPFGLQPQHEMPHPSQSQSQQPQQQQQQQQPPPNMSAADYTAASTIHNLKSPQGQTFAQPPAQGFPGAATWGNFMIPNPSPSSMGMDMGLQGPPAGPGNATRHGSFSQQHRGNVMYFQGIPNTVPTHQLQRGYSVDSSSQYLQEQQQQRAWNSQSPSASTNLPVRPSTVTFGSDPHFENSGHFRNPTPVQADKSANLVNIPYAADIAQATARQSSVTAPSPLDRGIYTQAGNEPPRKRRKSQTDQDEAEWAPNGSGSKGANSGDSTSDTSDPKRRKPSTAGAQPRVSPLIGDDEAARRGAKKPRETLTEQQKRQHHIQSEKKRREIINQGYSDLNILVPCLNGGKSGLSRSECLQESASYIEALNSGTAHIMEQLGITESELVAATNVSLEIGAYGT